MDGQSLKTKTCRDCGNVLDQSARGCPRCALNFEAENAIDRFVQGLLLASLALVVLLVAGLVFLVAVVQPGLKRTVQRNREGLQTRPICRHHKLRLILLSRIYGDAPAHESIADVRIVREQAGITLSKPLFV